MPEENDYPFIDEILDFEIDYEVVECEDLHEHILSFIQLSSSAVKKFIKHRYLHINREEILDVIEKYAEEIRPKRVSLWELKRLQVEFEQIKEEEAFSEKRSADAEFEEFLSILTPEERKVALIVREKYAKG